MKSAAATEALPAKAQLGSQASLSMVLCEDVGTSLCSGGFEEDGAASEASSAQAAKKLSSSEGAGSAVLLSQFSLTPSSLAGVHARLLPPFSVAPMPLNICMREQSYQRLIGVTSA